MVYTVSKHNEIDMKVLDKISSLYRFPFFPEFDLSRIYCISILKLDISVLHNLSSSIFGIDLQFTYLKFTPTVCIYNLIL